MSLEEELMQFRTAYLRAIARAWDDAEFRARLTDGHAALGVMQEELGYTCPWQLTFDITYDSADPQGPYYNPFRGVYMTTPFKYEIFTLYIPEAPMLNRTQALADYYDLSPWFLRNKAELEDVDYYSATALTSHTGTRDTDNENLHVLEVATNLQHESQSNVANLKIPNTDYNLGDNIDIFNAFGAAMIGAVALTWSDETFKNQLITKQDVDYESNQQVAIVTLKEWLNYNYPWNIDLVVKIDTRAKYLFVETFKICNEDKYYKIAYDRPEEEARNQIAKSMYTQDGGEFIEGKWEWVWVEDDKLVKPTYPELSLSLPEEPEDPLEKVIGLTKYNADGPGFPFTC